ncbi:MAG TPA: NAD synthetase, partial [Gammaproteobacteria bacterium]|nr:NAD synthetase [Gammaproteobacteria bacterium]
MSNSLVINFSYIIAAGLFIFGLKLLGSPETARRGNFLSALGMFIAVVFTLASQEIIAYHWIIIGILIGASVGAYAARTVQMTGMPEMVALFNGFGGIASLFVGWAALFNADLNTFVVFTVFLSILIGGVTFSGSLVAWGKLSEKIDGKPIVFDGQRLANSLLLGAIILSGLIFIANPGGTSFWLFLIIALALTLAPKPLK